MRLLLDSHVALWWLGDDDSLGEGCREMITEADEVYFSPVTPWELGIKRARGRVSFPPNLPEELAASGFVELPIDSLHATRAAELPDHHRDPFDRMLVAQAQIESLTIATGDDSIAKYAVEILDAGV